MKRISKYLSVGLLAYLLFLVGTIPASQAYGWLQSSLGPLQLAAVDGTVWSGSAGQAQFQQYRFQPVSWSFRPLALLLGRAEYQISAKNAELDTSGRAGRRYDGTTYLKALRGKAQASLLEPWLGRLGVEPKGSLDLDLSYLEYRDKRLRRAEGNIVWRGAGAKSPMDLEFGEIVFELGSAGANVRINIKDRNGPVGIKGTIDLQPNGGYTLDMTLNPTAEADPNLVQSLRAFGRPGTDGTVQFRYSGNL